MGLLNVILDGLPICKCDDCGCWARPGEPIRHSKRCDSPIQVAWNGDTGSERKPDPQPQPDTRPWWVRAGRPDPRRGDGYSAEELLELRRGGLIGGSTAMNRDD